MTTLLGHRSPAFPTTVSNARLLSRSVMADRAAKVSWRAISEKMAITRLEAMKLGYSLDDVITEIKTAGTRVDQRAAAAPAPGVWTGLG